MFMTLSCLWNIYANTYLYDFFLSLKYIGIATLSFTSMWKMYTCRYMYIILRLGIFPSNGEKDPISWALARLFVLIVVFQCPCRFFNKYSLRCCHWFRNASSVPLSWGLIWQIPCFLNLFSIIFVCNNN